MPSQVSVGGRAAIRHITMNDYISLVLGLVCAGLGGEAFIRAAVSVARLTRVSAGIIGATVAAFATSSPELAVCIRASLAGTPQISMGDALGSNVVNVALILALALCVSSIKAPRESLRRDFPVALLIPVLIGLFALDGLLSRLEGLLLLVCFTLWLVFTVLDARKQRSAAEEEYDRPRIGRTLTLGLVGLALLIGAGHLVVNGARGIAMSYGIGEFVVGATLVAAGTSIPEMATTLIAKRRGHDEIGLGTILGSNIFNGLFIVAIAAMIHPISINRREVAVTLVFGVLTVACTFPTRSGLIGRWRGPLLLVLYGVYVATVFQRHVA